KAPDAQDGRAGQHWREDKIGLLQTMKSEVLASDPCPEIPEQFVDPTRIIKLARELKKQALPSEEAVKETAEPEVGVETLAENRAVWEPPEVQEKRFVAFRADESALGVEAVAVGSAAIGAKDAEHALGIHLHDAIAGDIREEDVTLRIDSGAFEKRDGGGRLGNCARRDEACGQPRLGAIAAGRYEAGQRRKHRDARNP